VGPVMHYPPRGNDARTHRWNRVERAARLAPEGALHAPGLSPRQAAPGLDVPRRTLQAWRASHERLDESPAVVAFFHSVPGLACLPRLVRAFHGVFVAGGAWGRRLGGRLWKLTGLHRVGGAS
jgi:hypothetical protein